MTVKNKQDINPRRLLHPGRNASRGRNGMYRRTLHPVGEASLTGGRMNGAFAFSAARCTGSAVRCFPTEYSVASPHRYRVFIFRPVT